MDQSKKLYPLLLCSILFTLALSFSCFAGIWKQDAKGYWYQNDDGSYPKNTWQWIDADGDHIAYCYYFDVEGYCLLNQKTPDGYMVSPSGEWLINRVNLPATTIVNTDKVNANGLPHIANMISYEIWNPFTKPKHLFIDFTKESIDPVTLASIFNIVCTPHYVSSYFPSFNAKYSKISSPETTEPVIALELEEFKKAVADLLNIQDIKDSWKYIIKGDALAYNLIPPKKGVFGINHYEAEEPFAMVESVEINQGIYTIKGYCGLAPSKMDEPIFKFLYTIVAKENPDSDFGHLTVLSLDIINE